MTASLRAMQPKKRVRSGQVRSGVQHACTQTANGVGAALLFACPSLTCMYILPSRSRTIDGCKLLSSLASTGSAAGLHDLTTLAASALQTMARAPPKAGGQTQQSHWRDTAPCHRNGSCALLPGSHRILYTGRLQHRPSSCLETSCSCTWHTPSWAHPDRPVGRRCKILSTRIAEALLHARTCVNQHTEEGVALVRSELLPVRFNLN